MNEYTVNFLFTANLRNVLLIRKNRTAFKGKLNGVGGELNPGEQPMDCALREILEETGLKPNQLASVDEDNTLKWLGTLILPYDCKYGTRDGCKLHYFAGLILNGNENMLISTDEELVLKPVQDAMTAAPGNLEYAGDGDLAYFVAAGARALRAWLDKD